MKQVLFLILSGLSALGILTGIIFFCQNLYRQNLLLRLDPLEENQLKNSNDCDFMAVGSSSIKRWPFEELKVNNMKICNAGIEGQTSRQVLMRIEEQFRKHCPRYLIVQVGINDIKTLGFFKGRQQIVNDYIENVKKIFALCRDNGIKVLFINNFPTGHRSLIRGLVWNKNLDKVIYDSNTYLMNFCKENNIFAFDAYKLLVKENSLKRKHEFSCGFFHLNSKGYDMLNSNLEPFIRNILITYEK